MYERDVAGRRRGRGATEAEVLLVARDPPLTRFAENQIHQNVAEQDVEVRVRVVLGRRWERATVNEAA